MQKIKKMISSFIVVLVMFGMAAMIVQPLTMNAQSGATGQQEHVVTADGSDMLGEIENYKIIYIPCSPGDRACWADNDELDRLMEEKRQKQREEDRRREEERKKEEALHSPVRYYLDDEIISESKGRYESKLEAPVNPMKEHHTFVGWFTEDGIQWDFATMKMPLRPVNLYAKFIKQYRVVFHVDGRIIENEWLEPGKNISHPAAPIKRGHTFIGWQYAFEADKDKLWDFENDTMPEADILLVARFEANTYLFILIDDTNGWVETAELRYGEELPGPALSDKTDKRFMGWYTEAGEKWDFNTDVPLPHHIVLYALWEPLL